MKNNLAESGLSFKVKSLKFKEAILKSSTLNLKLYTLNLLILLFLFSFNAHAEISVLTWEICLEEAKNNNPELISAKEGINKEAATKLITTSELFPQVEASFATSTAKAASGTTDDTFSYGLTGSQLLFDSFKTINDIKAAIENVNSATQGYRFTSSDIRLNLRTAFVNLLKAQELIKVSEDIIKIRKENYDLIKLRYESGLEHKGALLTAEANLAQANYELSKAKRDVEFYQRQLSKEMGRKEFTPLEVKGDFVVGDTMKEKPDYDALAQNHPSLLQLTAKKNSADFSAKSAKSAFFPKITGGAGASRSGDSWEPQDDKWNLGVTVTLPLFEGGSNRAELKKAKASYNQAVANERSGKDSVVVNLEKYWSSLQDALETVEVKNISLNANIERSKIAESQYSTGFITFDNWIIIENDLVNAKKSFLEAQANALIAEANWINAKGETLEYAKQ